MPFFVSNTDSKFLDPELSKKEFKKALEDYEKRKNDFSGKHGVFLKKDTIVSYFKKETIATILNEKKELIVARFGCEDAKEEYSNLSFVLCAMDTSIIDNSTTMYPGSSTVGAINKPIVFSGAPNSDFQRWRQNEANYRLRRDVLVNGSRAEFKDEKSHGIAHPIVKFRDEWFKKEVANGMVDIAVYIIKFPNHTTTAYVDARIDLNTLLDQYVIYDQGTGCCPA